MTAIRFSPNSGRIIEFGDITGGSAFNVTLPTGTTLSDVVDANAQGAQRGSGSPEGAVSARHAHDLYFRTSDSHVWYHAAGTTNTGWVDASESVVVTPVSPYPAGIRVYASVSDADLSGASGTILPAALDGSDFLSLTLAYGPATVAAGGTFGQLSFVPNIDASVEYAEVFASNADGTETLVTGQTTPIALTKGSARTLLQADWPTATRTGTDLSIDTNGKLKSAAGGSFWVVYFVQVSIV